MKWFLIVIACLAMVAGCGAQQADAQCLPIGQYGNGRSGDSIGHHIGDHFGLQLRLPMIRLHLGPGVNRPRPQQLPELINYAQPQPLYHQPVYQQPLYHQPVYQQRYHYQHAVRIKSTPRYHHAW